MSTIERITECEKLRAALRILIEKVLELYDCCTCDDEPPIMDSRNKCLYCYSNEDARAALEGK